MLTELRIRNFAIIDSLTLQLSGGLNVLSGETGAGKSIIVGALGLLLGERARSDVIRTGAEKAIVEGSFEIGSSDEVARLLDERGFDAEDGTVVLRREVAATGRTRAWINSAVTSAGVLAEIGRQLVNLHGQHEAQTLLDPEAQRAILDAFGGANGPAETTRAAYEGLTEVTREIEMLESRRADTRRRADYLRHVVSEIEEAKLLAGEEAQLEEEAHRLEHAEELQSLSRGLSELLDGDEPSALHALRTAARTLTTLQRIDPALARLQELFDSAYYALEELAREVDAYGRAVDLDPSRMEAVQHRRDLLFRLAKKYGPALTDVIATGQRARAELDLADSAHLDLAQLETRRRATASILEAEARALTAARTLAAVKLGDAVGRLLPELGMTDGRFRVALSPRDTIGPVGFEDVEFQVALNIGHDSRPLARIASGGEMSRVMLALKTILARLDRVPTLVFDEVDAGIGGRVGLQVGDTMRRVAEHHQVLAISHLPQIAARAHHHIVVRKGARDGVTTADTRVVEGEERIAEIARMLGGDAESEVSRAHARELLTSGTREVGGGGRRREAAKKGSIDRSD
ncbi:MAG: DNA repair protein RecN [Gemmatimonadaceae bacterium]